MKQSIKMLCLLLGVLMLSTVVYAQPTAAEKTVNTAVFAKLEAFGILEVGDDLQYEEEISRGTFLRYAARLLGDFPRVQGENPYSDISVDDDCYEEAVLFYSLGYISGDPGSCFRADDTITVGEASKIILGILGYGEAVAQRLNFPVGYITIAQRLELFNGVKTDGAFDAQDLANLMLNTLEAPLLALESLLMESDGYRILYSNDRQDTLLGQRFSIYPIDGLLESNAYSSIYGSSTVPHGCVSIGGAVYEADTRAAATMLGYAVEGYYKKGTSTPDKLLYMQEQTAQNTVYSLRGKDVDSSSITESGFSYYDEATNKTEKVKTERALVLLYNGVQKTYNKSCLTKEQAHITLIDNDRDGRVEVVSVMEYRNIVVAAVDSDGNVTDKLGGANIELNASDDSYDLFLEDAMGPVNVSDLTAGDVLSYAVPSGEKPAVKFVYVSHNSLTGKVTGKDDDGLWIDGKFYESEAALHANSVVGNSGTFLLDYFNRIVYKTIERDVVFGYLNMIDGDNFVVRAQIFTENGRWVELNFKDTFRFNHSKIKAEDFYATYGSSTSLYRQLVTYTVNDDAEIISMNFAVDSTEDAWTDQDRDRINDSVFRLSAHEDTAQYRVGMTSFGNDILLTAQTKLFMIPEQRVNEVEHLDDFYITSRESLIADGEYYNIYAYNADAMRQAEVCVLLGNSLSISSTSKLLLVESVTTSVKEDGTETYSIHGMYMGADMSIQTKDKAVIDSVNGGISGGDVIQIVYDNDGYVTKFETLYKSRNGAQQQFISGSLYALTTICAGRVERYESALKRIAIDYGNGIGIFMTNSLSNVYLYHTKSGKTERIAVEDIRSEDYVVGQVRYFSLDQMIVFRP